MDVRASNREHTSRPWRIHEIARDFRVEDVWTVPGAGGLDDFPRVIDALPFTSLYLLDDEFAAEVANETMHGVLHLGAVPDGVGAYRVQAAVLVKPNGLLGEAYMALIKPFRYLFVYPPMLRELTRSWDAAVSRRASLPPRPTASGREGASCGTS